MVRAELRETRSPEETNWYFAIEVWACGWAIGNMHWPSTKLKLTFYLINLYVAFTRWKKYAFLYSYSRVRWIKRTLQIKRSRLRKKAFQAFILIRKPKESPRRGIDPGLPRDRRGYSPLYYRGIGCVSFRLNGLCNGETPHLTLK